MNVLAFDTCFGACSAAVVWHEAAPPDRGAAGRRMAWRYEEMAAGHAERLIPMIDEVLRESGLGVEDLDAIAVTEGPGTFTGIRVGAAAARALSLAAALPIRATTSLHATAQGAIQQLGSAVADRKLAVCADARAGQVFVQAFETARGTPLTEAAIMPPAEAAALCPGAPLLCVGSGAAAVAEAALRAGRDAEARLPALQPDARNLARLAPDIPVMKPLVPLYLRLPDAKPQTGKSLPRAR